MGGVNGSLRKIPEPRDLTVARGGDRSTHKRGVCLQKRQTPFLVLNLANLLSTLTLKHEGQHARPAPLTPLSAPTEQKCRADFSLHTDRPSPALVLCMNQIGSLTSLRSQNCLLSPESLGQILLCLFL